MNVKELVTKLSIADPETEVYVNGGDATSTDVPTADDSFAGAWDQAIQTHGYFLIQGDPRATRK